RKIRNGQKWCIACREWHPVEEFAADKSRWDGRTAACRVNRNRIARQKHRPVAITQRKTPGPPAIPARDGDKKQARRRVNVLVRTGRLEPANDVACLDCGHVWTPGCGARHEYDHYRGYGP